MTLKAGNGGSNEERTTKPESGKHGKSQLLSSNEVKLATLTQELTTQPPSQNFPALDSNPPISLARFADESGFSPSTIWRYRRAGWLCTINICGRQYITRAEIERFNRRAATGEFATVRSCPRSK
jgi:hypothetical protein